MGFLDKVKSVAAEGLEKSQELAKTQQLKLELKKLENQLDEAFGTLGKAAFAASEAGGLSGESVAADLQAIHDAKAAVAAKQAEIDNVGADEVVSEPAGTTV